MRSQEGNAGARPLKDLSQPILDELSRYELRITGLPAGDYEVKIDGEGAGKVSSETLAAGWNLSRDAGPITRQSRKVLDLVFQKNDVFFRRWRQVQLFDLPAWAQNPATDAGRKAELVALDQRIAELEGEINATRRPASHRFEVTRVAR